MFPKQYKDYPGGVEFYDVYSPPMTTLYSQVWWSPLAPTPMPDEMIRKYNNSGMAIVGWEIDQVRRTPHGDVSVPISATYNHHYVAQMIGSKARFKKVTLSGPDDPLVAELAKQSHGRVAIDQPHYLVEQIDDSTMPVHQQFSSANGGEYRKTYHGFAPGHVLVVDSPAAMQITPMQIDTWHREKMDISANRTGPVKFVAGPLPRASLSPPDAQYSGLLECPMTTRLTKAIDGAYVAQNQGTCEQPILTFQECFQAAAGVLSTGGGAHLNRTGSDDKKPPGCSVSTTAQGSVEVFFNTLSTSTKTCADQTLAVAGTSNSLIQVNVSLKDDATITLKGPANVWFGVAFGAHAMADAPWTVVVDGTGAVTEHKLAKHDAGSLLKSTVKVVSNHVTSGVRTIKLTRPLKGSTPDFYTFKVQSNDGTLPILVAVGSGTQYAYHKDKAPTSLTLLPVDDGASCVCPEAPKPFGQATGRLVYHRVANQSMDTGAGAVGFGAGKCRNWPSTDLINMTNPTCDIRHYRGGQWACHHMWSLLDADQEIPWADKPLVFHHKYRFWVQPYNASYHTQLKLGETVGSALLIGSPWELDVPKCANGVPGCSFVDGTWIHTVKGSTVGRHTFAALNFHCHAPTCLSMAVYACDKGVAPSDCTQANGKLLCMQRPVYGGSGNAKLNGTRFDEAGYIAIPDCMWGSSDNGLEAPINVDGLPLHMVKTSNATWGHYGEMAGGQPWVF